MLEISKNLKNFKEHVSSQQTCFKNKKSLLSEFLAELSELRTHYRNEQTIESKSILYNQWCCWGLVTQKSG